MSAVALDPGFWAGRRVLVTGHTGFKGAWLALWLVELGAEVAGFSRSAPTRPSLFELARLGELVPTLIGDVRDLPAVQEALAETQPEVVLHLAAQPIVRQGYADPVGTFAANAMGTVHVLEAVRSAESVRVVINVTTDKVYENREWEWPYREDDRLGGRDPYASSKACAELVTAAYRASFFGSDDCARIATTRAGNVIGGGDWAADRLIPDLLRGARSGQPVAIRDPSALRPWQHVLNPLNGYLLLGQGLWDEPALVGAWNFGPAETDIQPVGAIADRLAELWGPGLRWHGDSAEHPHEAGVLKLDSSRARLRLRWRPRWNLDATLRSIVDFHRAHDGGADVRELMRAQVAAFGAAR